MDEEKLKKALRLARVAMQNDPTFAIIDAKMGYARSPTPEEKLLSEALLHMWAEVGGG